MAAGWDALLDAYEQAIAAVERAAETRDWTLLPDAGPLELTRPDEPPSATHRARYRRLAVRAERARQTLAAAMAEVAGTLEAGRRQRDAVRAYRSA